MSFMAGTGGPVTMPAPPAVGGAGTIGLGSVAGGGGTIAAGGGSVDMTGFPAPGYVGGGASGSVASCCVRPCGAVCGPVGACGMVTNGSGVGQLQFVGGGRGSYTTETQYRYVGNGCGEFDYVKPPPNYCICIFSSTVLSLLLLLLLFFLFKDQTATTTIGGCTGCLSKCAHVLSNNCQDMITRGVGGPVFTSTTGPCSQTAILKACTMCASYGPSCQAPLGPTKTCTIWGDPHILTFDSKRVDFYTEGEYWIVKSTTVQIQGQYKPTHATNGLSVLKAIAFGGPFMESHKLIVGADFIATFDGQPILSGFPASYQGLGGKIQAQYNNQGATMQEGRDGKPLHVVHLTLPLGVTVVVNRWMEASEGNYINARITMSAQPQQDGHCGNFNGDLQDDDRLQIRARIGRTGVAAGELFFPGGKTPIGQSKRPDINDCDSNELESAKTLCKSKEKKFIPSMACLVDVCFGGKGFAADDAATGM